MAATTVTDAGSVRIITETIHIFTGIIHVIFGIILTVSEHGNPSLPVASGIFFWLGILLLVSGSLLVESERRDSPVLVKACCVVNVGVVLATLVATGIHGTAINQDLPGCGSPGPFQPRPGWCLQMEGKMLSNGVDFILALLGLLEFCVAVAVLAFGYDTFRQHTYTQLLREAGTHANPGNADPPLPSSEGLPQSGLS